MMPSKHGQNNRLKIPKGVSDKKLAFRRTLRVKKKKKTGEPKLQCRGSNAMVSQCSV